MFQMRDNYPVLADGYYLQQLSNKTYNIYLPGSVTPQGYHTPTETGLWSVLRSSYSGVQNLTGTGQGEQSVWLLYGNENKTVNYKFDCKDKNDSLISPFDAGTVVKNLFPPHEEYTLEASALKFHFDGSDEYNGCLPQLEFPPWGFKAFVPKQAFVAPRPAITKFLPGHDYRMLSTQDVAETVTISLSFSQEMDCDDITKNILVTSTTNDGTTPSLDTDSVSCNEAPDLDQALYVGQPVSKFTWSANLVGVMHGVHRVTVNNVSAASGITTNAIDHFLLRRGRFENPVVWPKAANYSKELLFKNQNGDLYVSHSAAGADKWRYSLNWGTTFSEWLPYTGGNNTLEPRRWSGTKAQAWKGEHVIVDYWGRLAGSSAHRVQGDLNWQDKTPRRFPHIWLQGNWNQHGYDAGLKNQMKQQADTGDWVIDFMDEWPSSTALNVWGINPDGQVFLPVRV